MEDLFSEYCQINPNFIANLIDFPQKKLFLEKLRKETNKTNFSSTLSELRFGQLFYDLGFQIEHDKKYNNQTPDWTISYNKEHAICEVYKLNKSKKDQIKTDFQNELHDKTQLIKFNYIINISFIDVDYEVSKYNIKSIIEELNDWFNKSKKAKGDKIILFKQFKFEVIMLSNFDHIYCFGPFGKIDFRATKLIKSDFQRDNEITKKLSKYNSIIKENHLSYFLAIDIDSSSGFNFNNFSEYFRGTGFENKSFGQFYNDDKGKEWTELGEFYKNNQLSGLILRFNHTIKLLMNPDKSQCVWKSGILDRFDKIERL